MCAVFASSTFAAKWTLSSSASATETYNWYSGEGAPAANGFVTSLTQSLGISGQGGRLKLNGNLSATELFYPGQSENNSFAPSVSLLANLEAIEKFFFIDASVNVSQTYISPFGAQPGNLTVPTSNRYTSESYGLSPYIQGAFASNVTYLVRDDSNWTTSNSYGNSSLKVPATYYNNLGAQVVQTAGPNSFTLQYNRYYYDNGLEGGTYIIQVERAIASHAFDPQLTVSARGGYETERFPLASGAGTSGESVIYGVGVDWRPTERTELNGFWEHQFFGSSYSWTLSHRLPNVALNATFTRGISSFPQLALVVPGGVPVGPFLDAAFTTRIPDPTERAAAVAQFLAQTGLPPTLITPLNFYAAQLTVQQTATASAVWIGALNSLSFTVFNTSYEAIAGTGSALPPAFSFGTNNTQTGVGVSLSHSVSPLTNVAANATYSRTTPNSTDPQVSSFRSNNFNASLSVNTSFTPKTTGSAGVTYFNFNTPGVSNAASYSSAGIYATISHTF